jgi:hypothetical protein
MYSLKAKYFPNPEFFTKLRELTYLLDTLLIVNNKIIQIFTSVL